MTKTTLHIKHLAKPTRLDRILRDELPNIGRQAVNRLIQERNVQVNRKTVWINSWKVKNGDVLTVRNVPDALPEAPTVFDSAWIIAEDDDLVVLNKPAGLLSHATKYGNQADLLSLAEGHFGKLALMHRLDRDTSGVMLFARHEATQQALDSAFKQHTIEKHYIAIVHTPNDLSEQGTIRARLKAHPKHRNRMQVVEKGGKFAQTDYQVSVPSNGAQCVFLQPKTGRTHQLRVHLAHVNAPIWGDRYYSDAADNYPRLFLHAHQLTIPAFNGQGSRTFTAPAPDVFLPYVPDMRRLT
ncbi:MAG: RluA family pseudouridine synthase [Chloroflexota bacterium]